MRGVGPVICIILCLTVADAARADIFAFTDAAGVTHYSNVPVDRHYVRLISEPPAPPAAVPAVGWRVRASTYTGLIEEAAHRADVNPALLRAMVAVESAFNPLAVSPKGAQGLMQLLPATLRRYRVNRPFDPGENLRGGASYIKDLLKRYGNDLELALAAYNAGEDAVDRHGKTIPPFPETRAYVPAVLRFYRQFQSEAPSS
jgi:soluble lytic murein transglycosylase-like protein